MSLKSWIKEFYPFPAALCGKKNALDHTIRKWRGALPHNLIRHDVSILENAIVDNDSESQDMFWFNEESCALCNQHPSCCDCPLYKLRNECCTASNNRTCGPYDEFIKYADHNPRPMLRLLYKARKLEVERKLGHGKKTKR